MPSVSPDLDAESAGTSSLARPAAQSEGPATTGGNQTTPEATPSATAPPTIDPARVRSLLAGLTVAPRADGGMVLQADRAAAGVLAEVLRGLANAIEGAAGGVGT